ncbi:hypothetical protein [Planococcus sp. YIM B11945]|uniref:hypothetical protein n=1 Tax=Planococcus sp. YIM B11945 TaxID=3435410 RepID=UPI003D7DCEEF
MDKIKKFTANAMSLAFPFCFFTLNSQTEANVETKKENSKTKRTIMFKALSSFLSLWPSF